ncbi:peptidoglycan-binding domain-containing protein [Microbacterium aurugineum]|uniref:peptidoglycan-binding domain-containing protein n=1 Tax=Microbacterium aurugineum TaxID=2851642 RepID=UPI0020C0376E|nr:peptidoglycan-binding domain-containing protein [Microbacterium aurugineum]MCK8475645.1 peptidoglycan-binding protein [Microbacterium aurugineum]
MVLIVAVMGVGFWFASQFQSAAQQEADAKAPAAGPVFADVRQGALTGEVTFAGQVGPSMQTPVTVLPTAGSSLSVVTGHPLEAGAAVSSGQVLTEVNGRPLFGAHSSFAFYRDMGVGDRGPDVEALQGALAARSYPVTRDGRFGRETAAAVKRWYEDSGYVAPTRSGDTVKQTGSMTDDAQAEDGTQVAVPEVYVPVVELVALPGTSAQVVRGVQIGQRLGAEGQPDFILGSADLVVTITTPVSEMGDIVEGDAATISIDGEIMDGTVGEIRATGSGGADDAAAPDTSGGEGDAGRSAAAAEVTFTVIPKEALPGSIGRARVGVITEIVAEEALIVPVLAVSDRGAEKNILTKRADDGSLVEVPVSVLGVLQGEVAVEPVREGGLDVGDQVRVG